MLREQWSRSARLLVRATLVLLLAAVGIAAAGSRASAGTQGWDTTTAVLPGGTLTIEVNVPSETIVDSTNVDSCPITGLGHAFITYTCDATGPGIPSGTHLVQDWSDLNGPYSETVTYNANGAMAGEQTQPTPCTQTDAETYTSEWSCRVSALQTSAGQTLTIYVLASDKSLVINGLGGLSIIPYSVEHIDNDDRLGSCLIDLTDSTPTFAEMVRDTPAGSSTSAPILTAVGYPGEVIGGIPWGSEIKAVFKCGQGEQIPGGTGLVFDAGSSATVNGEPAGSPSCCTFPTAVNLAQTLSYTSPPSPTTQTIFGPPPPALNTINPTSGPAGSTVTLTGTGLTAFTVSFGGSPGSSSTIGPSGGSKVNFSGIPASNVNCSSATSCTATVPTTAAANNQWNVTLTNSAGTSNGLTFTTTAGP